MLVTYCLLLSLGVSSLHTNNYQLNMNEKVVEDIVGFIQGDSRKTFMTKVVQLKCNINVIAGFDDLFSGKILKTIPFLRYASIFDFHSQIQGQLEVVKSLSYSSICISFLVHIRSATQIQSTVSGSKSINHNHYDRFAFIANQAILAKVFALIGDRTFREVIGIVTSLEPHKTSILTRMETSILDSLRGKHLTVMGVDIAPWSYIEYDRHGQKVFKGSGYNIIKYAAKAYNFSYSMDVEKGRITGYKLPNGTWDGLIAKIIRREADIGLCLSKTLERSPMHDFSTRFVTADLIFCGSFPVPDVQYTVVFYPFETKVWILIGVVQVCIIPLFYYAIKARVIEVAGSGRESQLISKAILRSIAISLTETTTEIKIQGRSIRFVSIMWIIYTLLITSAYVGSLRSHLSIPRQVLNAPTTLQELANDFKEYSILFHNHNSAANNFLDTSPDRNVKLVRARMIDEPNGAECVRRSFNNEKVVCVGWKQLLEAWIARNLTLLPQMDTPMYYSEPPIYSIIWTVATQRNSVFTNAIHYIVSWFIDTGLVDKWTGDILASLKKGGSHWMKQQDGQNPIKVKLQKLVDHNNLERKALTLNSLVLIFATPCLGIIFALLSFLIETFSENFKIMVNSIIRSAIMLHNCVTDKLFKMQVNKNLSTSSQQELRREMSTIVYVNAESSGTLPARRPLVGAIKSAK